MGNPDEEPHTDYLQGICLGRFERDDDRQQEVQPVGAFRTEVAEKLRDTFGIETI